MIAVDLYRAQERAFVLVGTLIRERLRPPSRLTVTQWADTERVLPKTSAEPGQWRTSRAPWLRKMMDCCSDPAVERVVWRKPAQVGGTEFLLNLLGYFIDQDPAPVLFVQISDKAAKAFSKERIAPMIVETPALASKVSDQKTRDSTNTIEAKEFPGGHLAIVGANAPAGLRSRPRRVLLADEVDGWPLSAGNEGDPLELARKRLSTFWNSLEVCVSTPTIEGHSRITALLEAADVVYAWHFECPHCEGWQEFQFGNLKWETEVTDGRKVHHPETAALACIHCGTMIEERYKTRLRADWLPDKEAPANARRIGFRSNAMKSPWVRWSTLAEEFLEAKDNPLLLQVFVNTRLGETWEERGQVEPGDLAARAEEWAAEIPEGVGLMTAGVDVQDDRLELAVVGWGEGEESWLLTHERLHGDPERSEVWAELEMWLSRPWRHVSGKTARVRCCMVDSQFLKKAVTSFVKPREMRGVYASIGVDQGRELLKRAVRRNRQGMKPWTISTFDYKTRLFRRLGVAHPGPGFMHFCAPTKTGADREFFEQFGGEILEQKIIGGRWVRRYKQVRRNEAIDLYVLAMAALDSLGEITSRRLGAMAAELSEPPQEEEPPPLPPQPRATSRRGRWAYGWRD